MASKPRSTTPPNDSAPITDFSVIEAQKENIRPTPSGRSAATLSTLLEKDAVAEKAVQEGHDRFRKEIEEAERRDREGEDMTDGVQDILDIHSRYVLYNVQHHPSSDNHLIPLLETTTRRFLEDTRYQQDIRYLKLWIQYARFAERREEIWAFLESKDVGTKHSAFYEEWATALERLSRKKKADEIYKLGIARKAAPIERLKQRHAAFLERIMAVNGQIPEDEPTASSSRTPARSVLGQAASAATAGGIAGASQLAPSMRTSTADNGKKMSIFSDENGNEEAGEGGDWADLGTRDSRRKENTVDSTPWKGETLAQNAAKYRVTPRTPKVEVFKDVTDNENAAIRPAEDIFSRSKQPPTEAELLKNDPLRHYNITSLSTSIPSLPPPPSVRKPPRQKEHKKRFKWECPTDGPVIKDSKGKVKEKRMFDWDQVFKGDVEWSFEEIRAKQRGLYGKEYRGEVQDWERQWHAPGSSTPKKEVKKVKPPSPTVNTKLANEEIAAMFDQTIHGGKIRDSDSESSDTSDDEDQDELPPKQDIDMENRIVPLKDAPTPLPASRPVTFPTPSNSLVPPTPTPASSGLNTSTGRLNIFADENSLPQSTAKAKVNVFSETPAKTPLVLRTPLASSSKPKSLIFQDLENDEIQSAIETPSINRRPLGNVFATPALKDHGPARRLASQPILEENEDEGSSPRINEEEELQKVLEEQRGEGVAEDEYEENYNARRGGRCGAFSVMTPITERTCEFTSHTQFTTRSSFGGNGNFASSLRRSDAVLEDDENENEQPKEIDNEIAGLSLGGQEQDKAEIRGSSFNEEFMDTISPIRGDFDRSSDDPPFKMAEGFTIHQGPAGAGDRSINIFDKTATMNFGRADSVDRETEGEQTGQFVTATSGELPSINQNQVEINIPNPCCPIDESILEALLQKIDPPLSVLLGFQDYRSEVSGKLASLQKHSKTKQRRASQSSRTSVGAGEDPFILDLKGMRYEIVDKIGEGSFGAVFSAIDLLKRQEADAKSDDSNSGSESDEDDEEENFLVAIKVESPCSLWESIILDRIHRKSDDQTKLSIIKPKSLLGFKDESYLFLEYSTQGTLLDLVNKAQVLNIAPSTTTTPPALDELLAMFFTIELLRVLENLHENKFIHGDLKIDNCLVRLQPLLASEGGTIGWSNQYDRTGKDGWSKKGIKLIDMGRTIDLSLFPEGQKFKADWEVDQRDCIEIKEGKEWTYETDYAGLASIVYCMLFGKYIQTEVVDESGGRKVKITGQLKRYWQTELWSELFDILLNPKSIRSDQSLPINTELREIRTKFEDWLELNCTKNGKNLRGMLKKIETAAFMGKRL